LVQIACPTRDQIADRDVIALGLGVLEVGERIDARSVRKRPTGGRELLDGLERVGLEHAALPGLHDEENVVGLREGALEVLEGRQSFVVLGEEDPVVGGEPRLREPEGESPKATIRQATSPSRSVATGRDVTAPPTRLPTLSKIVRFAEWVSLMAVPRS
jgi:hypothetical protein